MTHAPTTIRVTTLSGKAKRIVCQCGWRSSSFTWPTDGAGMWALHLRERAA